MQISTAPGSNTVVLCADGASILSRQWAVTPKECAMRHVFIPLTKRAIVGGICAAALSASSCTDGIPTTPSASGTGNNLVAPASEGTTRQPAALALLGSSPRQGDVHITKNCPGGNTCTITSSNVKQIEVGSTILYLTPSSPLDSDIIVDVPGPGNNKAFGHCNLDFSNFPGLCTLAGGTGKFSHIAATVSVSDLGGGNYAWEGTYSFD